MQQISLKQNYLLKQNRDLRFHLQQLQQILSLNKLTLRKNFNSFEAESRSLITMLYDENTRLHQRLNKNYDDLSMMNSTMLIGEQIVMATESHEKRLIEELQNRIKELKKELREREKRVVELEQARVEGRGGNVGGGRVVVVTAPGSVQLKYHDEIERLNDEIRKKEGEAEKEKGKYEELLKVNILLNKQILDMKVPVTSVSTGGGRVSDYKNLLDYHRQLGRSDSESSYNSHSHHSSQQQPENKRKKALVPKLQLSKAKEIQQLIVKKINNKDKKQHAVNNNKGETNEERSQLQKELQEEKIKNHMSEKKVLRLQRIVTELEERNRLLVEMKVVGNRGSGEEGAGLVDCPSKEYMQELERRHILEVARDVYLNERLDRVMRGEVEVEYRDGAMSD